MALPPQRVALTSGVAGLGVLIGGIAAASRSISVTVADSSKATRNLAREAQPIMARQRAAGGGGAVSSRGPVHPEVWLVVLEAAVFATALVLLGAIAVPALRRWREDRRARVAVLAAADVMPDGEPDEDEERARLGEEVAGALAVLDEEHDARAAVIVCWSRLEEAVAANGEPRQAAETSEELTSRVLGTYSVDAGALRVLHGTYRRARFSSVPLEPDARDAARQALLSVRGALGSAR